MGMGTLSNHSGAQWDVDCGQRLAVGYVRVSTEMQTADGHSLDAQTAAIEQYCSMHQGPTFLGVQMESFTSMNCLQITKKYNHGRVYLSNNSPLSRRSSCEFHQ
jgi:hypothetical protein